MTAVTMAQRRFALMDITDTTRTIARLMAITDRIGFTAVYSLAPDRGSADSAEAIGVVTVGAAEAGVVAEAGAVAEVGALVVATEVDAADSVDVGSQAVDKTSPDEADLMVAPAGMAAFMEVAGSTVAADHVEVADSTEAVDSTEVAALTEVVAMVVGIAN